MKPNYINIFPITNKEKWNVTKYATSHHIEHKNDMLELFLFAAPAEVFHYYGENRNEDTFLEEGIEILYTT